MTSLAWKLNRLRLMGPAEIGWRIGQALHKRAARLGIGMAYDTPAPSRLDRLGRDFIGAPAAGVDTTRLLAAADTILAGRWNVFSMRDVPLGFPPQWNRDPKTGTVAPLSFGKAIDYRDERIVGDIKYLWEPNRHLELVTLAQAWQVSRDPRYADGARSLITSWLDQCPYPMGVHWTSSLELAVRLLNWSVAWQLLGGVQSVVFEGTAGSTLRDRWLQAIYRHAHFISGHFSVHSSANNHLLGEYMGLYVAGTTWPCWPQMREWREIGRRGLEAEALKQNGADGVNHEQAVYYQHEVMDMMLLTLLMARAQGEDFPAAFLERLERLSEFLHALMDAGGQLPMQGDADDALMLRLSHEPGWSPYASLLAACAILFGRGDFKAKVGRLDDKTRWLLGTRAEAAWAGLAAAPAAPRMSFAEGGHYLLGADFDTPQEVRIAIDCAPLGYLSIAAHGHADALAFTLSAGGHELLIDPGTYAYHTHKAWRDYFRGTLAHNTVRIDGVDQSVIGGNFMWLDKARARATAHEPAGPMQRFVGEHDGYRRLPDPVLHRRELQYDVASRTLVVTDHLETSGTHQVELSWHWHENATVVTDGASVTAQHGTARARLACESAGFVPTLHRGEDGPIVGWVSRRFDEKQPSPCTVFRGSISGSARIVTRILVEPTAAHARQ